ncbi:MAG: hypothetical protein HC924_12575 [Synechococcaceae cyanobacterium SM2_3_2]|nr:hypothetical protein [Synechococcaceae cyanobacterium SM2_3_2]
MTLPPSPWFLSGSSLSGSRLWLHQHWLWTDPASHSTAAYRHPPLL